MRIAITSLYLPSGSKIGVGYQVHDLANQMVRRGHEVTVFSQSGATKESLHEVVVVPPRRRLRTFGFALDLRQQDFSRFDVLNAHGDDWFLWGIRRPRHIHTFHGSCLAEMLHGRGIAAKSRMAALAICELSACAIADELVAVSADTRRYIPAVRQIIPNGVDLDAFSPSTEKSRNPTVLFVGTMHGRKRGAMLLDIFKKEIAPKLPGAEFWAVCETEVSGPGVRWFGRVDSQRLADLFRTAWVFCLPSSYEGFGIPYIEAMASGTAVVASRNGGAIEVTENGRYGILASDQDLGASLVSVLTLEPLRKKMEEAGLARSKVFGWDRVCPQYEKLYRGSDLAGVESTSSAASK